ncbi:MAG: CHAT domain-containing protein [Leptolyngbyaceae cyanobacterium SL_1_1]|nr:CHAT domain-containing protein [Leptolyngbyaceae cyanobacterium SL_1_1]
MLINELDINSLSGSLRLEAANDVRFEANILNSGAGQVAFTVAAGNQVIVDEEVTINTGGGNFTVDNSDFIFGDDSVLNTQGGTIEHTGGGFTLINGTLNAGVNGRVLLTGTNSSGAGITVNGSILSQNGQISLAGTGTPGIDLQAGATLDAGGGTIALSGVSTTGGGLVISGLVSLQADQLNLTGTSTSGNGIQLGTDLNANGSLSLTGNSASGSGVLAQNISSGGSDISLTGNSGTSLGILAQNISSGGGSIALASDSADIEVSTLEATGSAAAISVAVATDQFFRATGSFDFGSGSASIASSGGPISIQHGGNGTVPFIVGDASQNGTTAAIANSPTAFNFSPVEEILFTTARNGVAIQSVEAPVPIPPSPPTSPPTLPPTGPLPGSTLSFTNVECLPDCQTESLETQSNIDQTPILSSDEASRVAIEQRVFDVEAAYTQEFLDYLNVEETVPIQSVEQGQQKLQEIVQTTGTTPAILYVSFTPAPGSLSQTVNPVSAGVAIQPETENAIFLSAASAPALKADTYAQQNQPKATDQLELILVTPQKDPIYMRLPDVTRSQVLEVTSQLRREVTDRTRRRTTSYLPPAQQLYQWIVAPLAEELEAQNVQHLSFVLDEGLRSLPVAVLHSGQEFMIERYSVALMPSLSLTNTRYQDVRGAELLAMGATRFADLPALPAVSIELSNIVGQIWPGEALVNEQFTPASLTAERRDRPYSLLHLATHGEFNPGSLENSFIQFWDQRVQLNEIRQLQLNDPLVELLVLSACRTALGNTQAELGFAGLAVQTGAKSALASLWLVDDVSAASFMIEFYSALRTAPMRAAALQQAQLAMMRGETRVMNGMLSWSGGELPLPAAVAQNLGTLSHPYFWSAFTLIGSPW